MAYSEMARALRRCRTTTKAGEPCQQFAVWGDEAGRCAAHGGRVPGPHRAERTAYVPCQCMAYRFPHRPAGGLCRWPAAPLYRSSMRPGTHSGGTDARKKIRQWTRQPTILFFHWRV